MMHPKENARRILRFDRPERVVGGLPGYDCSYHGVNHHPFTGVGPDGPVGTRWRDIWGIGWRKELDGVMGVAVDHPLADLARLPQYTFPDPDDPRICRRIYDRATEADRESYFVVGSHRETLWERSYNLVGMETLMLAFADAPEGVREVLHRVMDFQLGIARHYVAAGIEVAALGDDLGSQRAPLFRPQTLREFFVPEYRRLCSFYKQHGVLITFHSCGHIEPVLDVYMDLGVDVLNPAQATANDLDTVRRRTQGRMALQGGVSAHTVMVGPVEAIRREVRTRLWQLGRHGGYFCGPDQGLPFPEAHRRALRDEVERYGVYPLHPPDDAV